jgi:hypothetical protein
MYQLNNILKYKRKKIKNFFIWYTQERIQTAQSLNAKAVTAF